MPLFGSHKHTNVCNFSFVSHRYLIVSHPLSQTAAETTGNRHDQPLTNTNQGPGFSGAAQPVGTGMAHQNDPYNSAGPGLDQGYNVRFAFVLS